MTRWIVALLLAANVLPGQTAKSSCDRTCLEGMVQQYLDALVAHNPFGLPLGAKIKFSENEQLLDMGDGLWNVTTDIGSYRLIVADPQAGQVAFLGTVKENGTLVGLAFRLKVENRRITEIESLVVRDPGAGTAIDAMGHPNTAYMTAAPAGDRLSRTAMIAAADKYWDGVEQGNGDLAPFAADCNRVQNGVQTTNNPTVNPALKLSWNPLALGCRDQLNTKFFNFVQKAYPRRWVVVDEERQLLVGILTLQVPGDMKSVNSPGHGITEYPADLLSPFFYDVFELYKFNRGKIRNVEALQTRVPYGTPNPFFKDTWRVSKEKK